MRSEIRTHSSAPVTGEGPPKVTQMGLSQFVDPASCEWSIEVTCGSLTLQSPCISLALNYVISLLFGGSTVMDIMDRRIK